MKNSAFFRLSQRLGIELEALFCGSVGGLRLACVDVAKPTQEWKALYVVTSRKAGYNYRPRSTISDRQGHQLRSRELGKEPGVDTANDRTACEMQNGRAETRVVYRRP